MERRLPISLASVTGAAVLLVTATIGTPPAAATDDADTTDGGEVLWPDWLGNVPGLGAHDGEETTSSGAIALAGCTITNPLIPDDPERVRDFVPEQYLLGGNAYFPGTEYLPTTATLMVAALGCDAATISGNGLGPIALALIAVQVVAEATDGGATDAAWDRYNQSTLNFLPSSSWYLLAAHTDNAELAAALRGVGMPVGFVEDLRYETDYTNGATLGTPQIDELDVPAPRGGAYTVATTTHLPDPFEHDHDWFFWHDGRYLPGTETQLRTGFMLHLDAMDDSSCGYHVSATYQVHEPSCGTTVTAQPGTQIADFLGIATCAVPEEGCHRTTPYAFNHPPKLNASGHPPGGSITLLPPDVRASEEPT